MNPPEHAKSHRVDLQLDPGERVRLQVVDINRRPVTGAAVTIPIPPHRVFSTRHPSAEFDVQPLEPGSRRLVLISQRELGVGKVAEVGTGDDRNGPVIARLDPLATIEGLVSDAEGKPAPFVNIRAYVHNHRELKSGRVSTDRNGRFNIPSVPVARRMRFKLR